MAQIKLGDVARDTITGFEGTVVARTEWLFGCTRLTLQPPGLFEGKALEGATFDEPGLELVTAGRRGARVRTGGPRPEPTRAANPSRR